ncbi:hypothetical protein ACFOHK_08320 [Falsigemmobacter intermedius]|nr:hypothetical protein [Falsigemmobacter intermedius]
MIKRLKRWLGICDHDFRMIRRGQASFLRCTKCRTQTLPKEGRK